MRKFIILNLVVTLSYFVTGKFGLYFALPPGYASPIFPPAGISFAAVWFLGPRILPGVWLGSFILNLEVFWSSSGAFSLVAFLLAIGIAAGSTLQTFVAGALFTRFASLEKCFEKTKEVLKFVLITFGSCSIASAIGSLSLFYTGFAATSDISSNLLTWLIGDAVGVFTLTPILMIWVAKHGCSLSQERPVENAFFYILFFALSFYLFSFPFHEGTVRHSLAYLYVPFMIWAAFRQGPRGVSAFMLLACITAIWGTMRDLNLEYTIPYRELFELQSFIGVMTLSGLFFSAAVREKEAAFKAFQESENRLELAFEAAPMAVWEWNVALRKIYWSPSFERLHGFVSGTFEGELEDFEKIIHQDDRLKFRKSIEEAIQGSEKYQFEYRVIEENDSIKWFETFGRIFYDSEGLPVRILGICIDITVRRYAEDLWRRVLQSAPNALMMVSSLGKIEFVNAETEKLFGYSEKEMIGQDIDILIPKRFQRKVKTLSLGTGDDLYGLRNDGIEIPLQIGLNPIQLPDGVHILGSIVDIAERKKAEEKFRLAVEAAPNAMIMVNKQGNITLVNSQTEKLFGYNRTELFGKAIDLLVPERFRAHHANHRSGFFMDPKIRPMGAGRDLFGLKKDGTEIPIEIGLNPIETDEGLVVLASVVDITERKQIEMKLASLNEDLERKVQERTTLAEQRASKLQELTSMLTLTEQRERKRLAQILHDHLQQMLVASKIAMEGLSRQISDVNLRKNITQVKGLLDDAIEASRTLTAELSPPILRDAGLAAAIDWLVRWFKQKHRLRIKVESEANLKSPSEDIRIFLFQSIREILFNVVKHAEVQEASIKLFSEESRISIVVEDKGKGFDPSELSKQDMGFGLFNIRERLEMLGGNMEVKSAPGKGSWFKISAPASEALIQKPRAFKDTESDIEKEKEVGKYDSFGPIRVLVVDDHKILRQGIINLLQGNPGIRVVGEAGDGEEALQKAAELAPSVIIMDITMPKMNGIEATERIKSLNSEIQIIGLSIHDSEDIASTMRRAGASAYLSKNGPVDQLIKTIYRVVYNQPNKDLQGILFEE